MRSDGWLGWNVVSEAPAGEVLFLNIAEGAVPEEGCYFTGEFTVNGVSLGSETGEGWSFPVTEFTMPAGPVMIGAVQAAQETVTLDFTQDSSCALAYSAMSQLREMDFCAETSMFLMDEQYNEYIDLDYSGVPDLAVMEPGWTDSYDYTLALLPEADACGRYVYTFTGAADRYGAVTLVFPSFGAADFTLPADIEAIADSAFEGADMTAVYVPDGCASIGAYAFGACENLLRIRIPAGCMVDEHAFDGCGQVTVFAPAGSPAQDFCSNSDTCRFINDTGVYEHGNPTRRVGYTIRFLDEDGRVLYTTEVEKGHLPAYAGETPEKAADAQFVYAFSGWTPALAAADSDADYTAVYAGTLRVYTITFVGNGDTVLQTFQAAYGTTPVYTGETPTKPESAINTYSFANWYPQIGTVTGDAVYTAAFTQTRKMVLTITFVDDDGTVLLTGQYAYETPADQIITPENPIKPGTAFGGWLPAITDVTMDMTYTAIYQQTGSQTDPGEQEDPVPQP